MSEEDLDISLLLMSLSKPGSVSAPEEPYVTGNLELLKKMSLIDYPVTIEIFDQYKQNHPSILEKESEDVKIFLREVFELSKKICSFYNCKVNSLKESLEFVEKFKNPDFIMTINHAINYKPYGSFYKYREECKEKVFNSLNKNKDESPYKFWKLCNNIINQLSESSKEYPNNRDLFIEEIRALLDIQKINHIASLLIH